MPSKIARVAALSRARRLTRLTRLCLLALPGLLVAGAALRASNDRATFLWLGALVELVACILALISGPGWHGPVDLAIIVLYVTSIGWLIGSGPEPGDWYCHVTQAVLLVVPLCCFGAKFLRESGAPALRQARQRAARLACRTEWPAELGDCRLVPEVNALREVLHVDASPALQLTHHSSPQVRLAALAALEGHPRWRQGQPELVLKLARGAAEPEIRAAAVRALTNIADREMVEALSECFYDASPHVRREGGGALLGDPDVNWGWIRPALRRALAEPTCQGDGAVRPEGAEFSPEAVNDLLAWTSEKGLLGLRAALTLGEHYARQLAAEVDVRVLGDLRDKVEDVHAPPMLRLELARLLQQYQVIDASLLRQLVSPSTPAPLRLLAVEGLLASGESGQAVAALQDLGRLPNREIAVAVAEVGERRLGLDFGLPLDQPLPPVQSRLAAEVARRVLAWATQQEPEANAQSEIGSDANDRV
jgi:HEAT repeats